MRRILWLWPMWQACELPATVDEACPDEVVGDGDSLQPGAAAVILRIQCHRRFVGLTSGKVTGSAQEAAEAHATYLDVNGILDPESPSFDPSAAGLFFERKGNPGFTGETSADRMSAAGALRTGFGMGTWDAIFAADAKPDELFRDPYLRDVFFQPAWVGAGISVLPVPLTGGDELFYLNMAYAFPSNKLMFRPLVYPRDGQTQVPVSFKPSGDPDDPLSVADEIGFPITLTVGSDHVDSNDNPYGLALISVRLVDDQGVVLDLIQVPPQPLPSGDMLGTMVLAPRAPLQPGTRYDLDAHIRWNMQADYHVESSFITAAPGEDKQP